MTDIYIFGIGEEIYDDDLQPLTVGTGGPHYFRMMKIDNLEKLFDEIIGKLSLKLKGNGNSLNQELCLSTTCAFQL